ncbi:hypothetical protein ACHAXT_011935 [Thalassiosira profunda]
MPKSPKKSPKKGPAAAAAAKKAPPVPPAPPAFAGLVGGEKPTPQQQQLAEFNQWLYRWNNYQSHLAHYWQGRYNALAAQMAGGGKVKGTKKEREAAAKGKKSDVKWNMRFQELVDFKEEHGHIEVPKKFVYQHANPPLGMWCSRMRTAKKKGTLSAEREALLQEIGFEFEIKDDDMLRFSIVWNKSYEALKAFKDVNGHLEVPKGYKPHAEASELDGWMARQRKHFRAGKLPDFMKQKLQDLGLNLGGSGRPFGVESDDQWRQNYKVLAEYSVEHGDCDVPEKYAQDKALGNWVKLQRDHYSDGMLPEERVALLNQIGFNFYHGRKSARARKTDPWDRRLSELKAYKDKTGNTNVPKKFSLNLGLGDFVYNTRMAYKDKILSEEKIKSLEDLGFDFTIKQRYGDRKDRGGKETKWDKRFRELVEYKEQNGDLNVPDGYEASPDLGKWVKRQRKFHRETGLKEEKLERLQGIGFNFGGPKQKKRPWMEQYQALKEFYEENGHVNLPVQYAPNPPLYYWIGTQKQAKKKGKLSEDKIALMEEIGFDWSVTERDVSKNKKTRGGNTPLLEPAEWDKMYAELQEYKEQHGNVDVAQRDGRLGTFVHYMRFYEKRGRLSQERLDKLNELGFSWNVTDDRWNAKYEELCKWKADHGNFNIPSTKGPGTAGALCGWANYQRKLYAEDKLPEARTELLEKIDFDFTLPEPKSASKQRPSPSFDVNFQALANFKDEHGHCDVPPTYAPNPALAKWAASQRTKHRKGTLKEEHLDRLTDIGFGFEAAKADALQGLGTLAVPKLEPVDRDQYLEDLWENSYQELVAYKNHFGHCNIPISYSANPSLGAWAFSQKMAFKKDKLSQDRIDKLSELGFSFGKATAQADV